MKEAQYFFSYARVDSNFVLKLAAELRTAGANLWLDQLDILGGQRWDRAIEEALHNCEGMIVVISPDSIASDNVMDEVAYALEQRKLVVPVLYRGRSIPFRLRRVHYIDFTQDYENGFVRLLKALGIHQPSQRAESALSDESVFEDRARLSERTPVEEPPARTREPVREVGAALKEAMRVVFSYAHKDEELRDNWRRISSSCSARV
ncbi:MAG: toll/interleukin-1 receptor domain-containing protein [Pseudomonadota bacterium]|nr:toll/interleukin-1 receptor domain-containing protein [Pseudomonadota bacterium]